MEDNLGTICRTRQHSSSRKRWRRRTSVDIIGQFGVGFYSAFMVADEVTVVFSRTYGSDEAYHVEVQRCRRLYHRAWHKATSAGTDVIMKLKEDTEDEKYSRVPRDHTRLQSLVKKYSDYIRYPIKMDDGDVPARQRRHRPIRDKPEYETYDGEPRRSTRMVPDLDRRPGRDVTDEEYNSFYKEKFFDFEDPIKVIHSTAWRALSPIRRCCIIPAKAPYDYLHQGFQKGPAALFLRRADYGQTAQTCCRTTSALSRGIVDSQDL